MSKDEHRGRYREAFDRFPGPTFAVKAWPGLQFLSGYAGSSRDGDVFEIRVTFKVGGGRSAPRGKVIAGLIRDGVRPWDRAIGLLALTSVMEEAGGPIEGPRPSCERHGARATTRAQDTAQHAGVPQAAAPSAPVVADPDGPVADRHRHQLSPQRP